MSMTAAERERLEICSVEPIRRPGTIQPHGAIVAARAAGLEVVQVSANAAEVLGVATDELIGSTLPALFGDDAVAELSGVLAGVPNATNPVQVELRGHSHDALVHEVEGVIVVELEPTLPASEFSSAPALFAAIKRLTAATSREQLWAETAKSVRELTGFDKVMVYHFYPDEHGEVVAEDRDPAMERYLGLHFPASDIPIQARELYVTKLSRAIVSNQPVSSGLVPEDNPVTGEPLDLGKAELRSVSPFHLEFMRNMGQVSTLSLSLVVGGKLIGMITCAHRTTRRIPYTLRQGLEVLANQVAMQLNAMKQIERLTQVLAVRDLRRRLTDQFMAADDSVAALLHGDATLLDLVPAAGVVVCVDGELETLGAVPSDEQITELIDALRGGKGFPFRSDALPSEHPDLADLVTPFAGVLAVPFGGEGDCLIWFREEIVETIDWLGDQTPANRDTTLSPRNSFSSWSESVSGRSRAWAGLDTAAVEFGRDLDSALVRRAERTLAHLGLYDPLTGLANRRLLMQRLEEGVTGLDQGKALSLVFVDIDAFKSVNDGLGHDIGDALLKGIAERLVTVMRASDTAARLGGDEFVVVAQGSSGEGAMRLAERLLEALARPFSFGDIELTISASIGVAAAAPGDTAAGLLRHADEAMYRAKRAGKSRISGPTL